MIVFWFLVIAGVLGALVGGSLAAAIYLTDTLARFRPSFPVPLDPYDWIRDTDEV